VLENVREDARLFHALTYPGKSPTWRTSFRVVFGSRGFLLVTSHRLQHALAQWGRQAGRGARLRLFAARAINFAVEQSAQVVTKSEVRVDSHFDGGVYVSDRGHVVLGARAVGRGTVIHDRVTIGWGVLRDGTPRIGRNVWIGPNAVVLGNITIGDGATILPDTVLTRSVPPHFVVQGNPGRFVHRDLDNAALRATLATDVDRLVAESAR
jgi:serine O-acetyltransferase